MQSAKRVLSPSKSDNVVASSKKFKKQIDLEAAQCKQLELSEQENLGFLLDDDDDFDVSALDAAVTAVANKLDLSSWQRCVVLQVERLPKTHDLVLQLQGESSSALDANEPAAKAVCHLQTPWNQTPIQPGDLLSLQAQWQPSLASYVVNKEQGFCVIHPDLLISSTTVTGSLFCRRKAVLQDRFRGVDSTNTVVSPVQPASCVVPVCN